MKKRFGIVVMILALLIPALHAQEEESYKENEIGVNAGLFSTSGGIRYGFVNLFDPLGGFYYSGRNMGTMYYGHYGLHYYSQIFRWMQVGVKATVEPMHIKQYDSSNRNRVTKESQKVIAAVLPSIRFTYVNTPKFRLYSGVDMGIRYYGARETNYDADAENSAVEEVRMFNVGIGMNVTPIGMTFGRSLYGLFETNWGYDSMLKFGIGYRF